MSGEAKTKVVHAGEGKMIAAAGDLYRFLAEGEHTSQSYAIWEAVVPPGGGPPPHVQSREDEGFYVLEGEIAFVADGQKVIARKGTFLNVPRGVVHSFKNETDVDARCHGRLDVKMGATGRLVRQCGRGGRSRLQDAGHP